MNKYIYILACGLVLAAACSKNETEAPVTNGSTKLITLIASVSNNDTKLTFEDNVGFQWENNDLTNVGIAYTDGSWHHTVTTGGVLSESNTKAALNATLSVSATQAYAYYPHVDNSETSATHVYSIPAEQTIAAAGSTSNLLLASDAIDVSGNMVSEEVKFRIAGSLLRFFIYNSVGTTEKVQKVQVNSGAVISGDFNYNFSTKRGSVSNSAQQIGVTLTLEYDLTGITNATDAHSIFLPIVPGTTSWIEYLVTTDENIYTFHSTNSRTFAEGGVTEVKLNLSRATSVAPITSKIGLTYHFTDKGNGMVSKLNQEFTYLGEANKDLGWFIVAENGVEKTDYSKEYYTDITSNDEVSWVRAFMGGSNNLYITCDENESEDAREATLNVYFNETEDYVVVATAKASDGHIESISATDPIISLSVHQDGKPAADDPSLKYLTYFFRMSPGAMTSVTNPYTAPVAGISNAYMGYFFVRIGGSTNNDTGYTTADWYNNFTVTAYDESDNVVTWARITKSGDNQFYLTIDENDGAQDRNCTVKVFYSGDDSYTPYISDGVTLNDGDPVFSLTINQKGISSKTSLIYDFYTVDWSTMHQLFFNGGGSYPDSPQFEGSSVTAAGGTVHSGGQYRVYVDGTPTVNWTNAEITIRGDAVDGFGNNVDWVDNITIIGGKIYFDLSANDTGSARTATIRWFADDSSSSVYKVVGTYYTVTPARIGNGVGAEAITITSADPVFTLTITQPGV